jgi:hypothetical protein
MKKRIPYATSIQLHADRRFEERIGIKFNRVKARDIFENLKQYKTGKSILCESRKTRNWGPIIYEGIRLWVLVDARDRRVVTVLSGDLKPEEIWAH